MRFYSWTSQTIVHGYSVFGLRITRDGGIPGLSDAVDSVLSEAPSPGAISMRFNGFDSWHEWYTFYLKSDAISPITSFTGVLNGASSSMMALYRVVRGVLVVSSMLLKASLGIQISKKALDGAAETIMEFLAKSLEGMTITVVGILLFLAVFILRDWIATNVPVVDNEIDEAEEQANAGQGQDYIPNRIQVHARPIVAENPQNRPMFELSEFELPLLDDLPPGERPIHPQRHQQRSPDHTDTSSSASDVGGGSSWTSASGASDGNASPQDSPVHREEYSISQKQESPAKESIHAGTSYRTAPSPRSADSRCAWTYAEEAFEDEDDEKRNIGRTNIPSSRTRLGDPPYNTSPSQKDKEHDTKHASLTDNTQGSFDSDAASWSFVYGESSQKTARSSLPADADKQSLPNQQKSEDLPPTFTSERSRSIIGNLDNPSHTGYSTREGPRRDDNRDSDASYSSTSSEDGENDLPLYGRRMELLQRIERDRNIGIMQPNQILAPNPGDAFNPDALDRANLAQPLLNANREAPAPANANPDEGAQINNGNVQANNNNNNNNPGNADDNFGDFEVADGILEAVGLRGPLLNMVQYYMFVLVMVGLIMLLATWVPFTIAQIFILADPIHVVLYVIHNLSKAVDVVGEFLLDLALVFGWRPLRPLLVLAVNKTGPFVAYGLSLLVPGIKDVLSMSDESLWDKLTSPAMFFIDAWERNLWTKLVGWGIPVDKIALRLYHAIKGETVGDRIFMVVMGHFLGVLMTWAIITYTPRAFRKSTIYTSVKTYSLMIKIVVFILIELLLFPVLCGYCLDISLTPLVYARQESPRFVSYFTSLFTQNWTALILHWMLGMFFMVHFARFVLHLRQVVRPGLLWFIRDPSDPNFHPIRDIIEDKMLPQQYNIARSAVMYCGIIMVCVGLSMVCTMYVAPKDTFPMVWDSTMQMGEYPVQATSLVLLLPFAIIRGRPNEVLHCIFGWWWRLAARLVRLSEFVIGTRSIVDEGAWTVAGAPWLPDVLIRPFMPSHVVKGVFEVFNEHVFDEARVGQIEGALPTREYRARLQLEIDLALSNSHPHLAFVLEGQNMRAPNTDTVPVVVGRRMVIPVDDHGRPANDQFDYEAADYPEIREQDENQDRDLPPPAPGSSYRDRRFNPDQHSVLFVPPSLKARVLSFFVLGWMGIAAVSGATLIISLKIGKTIYNRLGNVPRHDVLSLSIGLLVLLVVSVAVYRVLLQVSEFYGVGADREVALQRLRRQMSQVGTAVLNSTVCAVVFCGIVPVALGTVVEVYFMVIVRDHILKTGYEDMFVRSFTQALFHNWMFGMMNVWVVSSALRFFPNSYWSRQMDRIFTGPPHTWHVWEGIRIFAAPVVGMSLTGVCLPFVLALAIMAVKGTLDLRSAASLFMFESLEILAHCSMTVFVAAVVFFAIWQACFMYRQWTRLARDETYLVGRQLHNLGENNNPEQVLDGEESGVAG
ncbi:hypothetical protein H4217_000045 [Coemansia sp. RSA 1939]|nr:hypothetical protein H4217_000045 [Coemansia sp. RSA 1939]